MTTIRDEMSYSYVLFSLSFCVDVSISCLSSKNIWERNSKREIDSHTRRLNGQEWRSIDVPFVFMTILVSLNFLLLLLQSYYKLLYLWRAHISYKAQVLFFLMCVSTINTYLIGNFVIFHFIYFQFISVCVARFNTIIVDRNTIRHAWIEDCIYVCYSKHQKKNIELNTKNN